jgi:hypothetical protein
VDNVSEPMSLSIISEQLWTVDHGDSGSMTCLKRTVWTTYVVTQNQIGTNKKY